MQLDMQVRYSSLGLRTLTAALGNVQPLSLEPITFFSDFSDFSDSLFFV